MPIFGVPTSTGSRGEPMDPRRDKWNVQEPAEKTLQAFMKSAATGVSASFTCPEQFNPAVAKAPSSGEIRKLAPQIAKAAGAKWEEVFLLMGRPPAPPGSETADAGRDDGDDFGFGGFGGGPPRGRGGSGDSRSGRGPDFTLVRERQLAEIAKLPADEQAAAKAEMEEREKFFASLKDLSDDERRAKFAEMANSPANQDKMADRQIKGGERKTPSQRLAKYQKYVAKKQQILSSKTQ